MAQRQVIKNVINFVEHPFEYERFSDAFAAMHPQLEHAIMKDNISYAALCSGWWMIENGKPLKYRQLVNRANAQGLIP